MYFWQSVFPSSSQKEIISLCPLFFLSKELKWFLLPHHLYDIMSLFKTREGIIVLQDGVEDVCECARARTCVILHTHIQLRFPM